MKENIASKSQENNQVYPIGFMGMINLLTFTFTIKQKNIHVGKYIIPMDTMGIHFYKSHVHPQNPVDHNHTRNM